MTLNALRDRRRLLLVVSLTLLPWPAVWLGMYRLDDLVWTFVLYHGLCLLPAAYGGRSLWRRAVCWPRRGEWVAVLVTTAIVVPLSVVFYSHLGRLLIRPPDVLSVVTERGFKAGWLLPLAFYFVPVNAVLEELFWRGVVLNELRGTGETVWTLGAVWTALTFAGWHYLVIRLLLRPGWAEGAVLVILAAGVFLAWLYGRTRSIVVPILWHGLVFDLPLLVIFGAVLRAAQ